MCATQLQQDSRPRGRGQRAQLTQELPHDAVALFQGLSPLRQVEDQPVDHVNLALVLLGGRRQRISLKYSFGEGGGR